MARIARWTPALAVLLVLLAPAAASAQVYQPSDLSEMPKIKSMTQARKMIARSYPRALKDAAIGGKVQVRFVVKPDGKVDPASVEVVAASVKALGDAAVKAVTGIKFEPGRKDGAPVASMVVIPITYAVS